MRASLYSADLHYGGNLVLHTASSGSISHLSEIYLRLDDGTTVGIGEVRANIAYLNGYAPETVTQAAVAAVGTIDWARDPADLLATMPEWAARFIAPVRTLIDCALHDLVARRAGVSVAASLGESCAGGRLADQSDRCSSRPMRRFSRRRRAMSIAASGI